MTQQHHRSGAWVEGHFRNGSWVEGHYRSGTIVHEYDTPEHCRSDFPWRFPDYGCQLVYHTSCWWCGEQVFFLRSAYGGCALFDSLGWPWPVHACWEQNRSSIEQRIQNDLEAEGYDGKRRPITKERRGTGNHGDRVQITGYITEIEGADEDAPALTLSSSRRSSTLPLAKVAVVSDTGLLYSTVVSVHKTAGLSPYDVLRVTGTWACRGSRRFLLLNSLQRQSEGERPDRGIRCCPVKMRCHFCADTIDAATLWGLDPAGRFECPNCGDMRADRSPSDFLRRCRRIARHIDQAPTRRHS